MRRLGGGEAVAEGDVFGLGGQPHRFGDDGRLVIR
jgi:hypothetical protein